MAAVSGGRGDLSAGDLLGEFRILKQIGRGGMGVVYLARDERLERRVALKVIAPDLAADSEFRDRFIAEARSAAAIDHNHVVPVYAAGLAQGDLYIAMRYIEGTDMRAALVNEGPLGPAAAVTIVTEIGAALDAAHAAGFVHRDIKPANILLSGEVDNRTSYLTDFGLTKGNDNHAGTLTGTGQWVGTIDYVAPEQIQSERVDARTDVYALGCVLYEAIAGSVPYAGNDMQKMWGHVHEPFPELSSSIPGAERVSAVIARATAKDPGHRFPSAGDLANAARAALTGVAVEVPEHSVATGPASTGLAETATARSLPPARRDRLAADQPTSLEQHEPPTRRMASPPDGAGLRTTGMIGAAVLLAGGLLAAAVVIAGGGSGDGASPVKANGGATEIALPVRRTECADGVYVRREVVGRPYTSCGLAREVADTYRSGAGSTFSTFSPVTGGRYEMNCEGAGSVRCSDGKTAVVYLTKIVRPSSSDALGDWPGDSAYAAMLGAFSSEWRARARQNEATRRGLDAGVLYSSNFSSLRPGYWVVFSGSFASSSEAAQRAQRAQTLGYSDSYPRFVSP